MGVDRKKKAAAKRYIPSEIITQINFRLPCKSLARFRSVNMQWRSCIDDWSFVNEYNRRQRTALGRHPPYVLVFAPSSTASRPKGLHRYSIGRDSHAYVTSTSVPEQHEAMISSSCGLICFHGIKNRSFEVYNPTSGEFIALPDYPEPYNPFEDAEHRYLRCCFSLLGFGFCRQSNEYKLVQLVRDLSTLCVSGCHVLTVKRAGSSWRAVEAPFKWDGSRWNGWRIGIFGPATCSSDGVLYWEDYYTDIGEFIQILAFELSRESFRLILSPRTYDCSKVSRDYLIHLVELQGNLCLSEVVRNQPGWVQMDISMLKLLDKDGYEWTRLYRLDLRPYPREGVSLENERKYIPYLPLCVIDDRIIVADEKALYSSDTKERRRRTKYDEESGDDTLLRSTWKAGQDYINFHSEAFVSLN